MSCHSIGNNHKTHWDQTKILQKGKKLEKEMFNRTNNNYFT